MVDIINMKVVVVGDAGSGKSQIVQQFTDGSFDDEYNETNGLEVANYTTETENNGGICLQILDIGGSKGLGTIPSSYYNKSSAIVLVYDITRRSTFDSLDSSLEEIGRYISVPIYLVANKTDLANLRVVSTEEGRQFAIDRQLKFFEVSAKTAANVRELFKKIANDPKVFVAAQQAAISASNKRKTIPNNDDRVLDRNWNSVDFVKANPDSPEARKLYTSSAGLAKDQFTPFQRFQIAYFYDHHQHWFTSSASGDMYRLLKDETYTSIVDVTDYVSKNPDSRSARVFYKTFKTEAIFQDLSDLTKFKIAYFLDYHANKVTWRFGMFKQLKADTIKDIGQVMAHAESQSENGRTSRVLQSLGFK